MIDAAACPAGEPYLTWDALRGAGPGSGWDQLAGAGVGPDGRHRAGRPGHPAVHLGHDRQPQGRDRSRTPACSYELAAVTAGGNAPARVRWVSYLPLAHIAERMFTLYLAISQGWHVFFCPDASSPADRHGGRAGPADGVLRRAAGVGEDPGRHPGAAGRRGGRDPEGGGGGGHGHRPGVRAQQPVRPQHARRSWPSGSPPPTRRCCGRSGRCSGWATSRSRSARRRRCRPRRGEFFAGLGMRILDVYGMTETTGAFTANTPDGVQARHGRAGGAGHARSASPATARS